MKLFQVYLGSCLKLFSKTTLKIIFLFSKPWHIKIVSYLGICVVEHVHSTIKATMTNNTEKGYLSRLTKL